MKTAQVGFTVAFTLGLLLGCGSNTARDWSKCTPSDPCKPGFSCSAESRCLPVDALPDTLLASPDLAADSVSVTPDGAVASPDTHQGADVSVEPDAPVTSSAVDAPVAADAPKDTFVEECRSSAECKEPSRSFCVGGACVGCDQAGYGACPGKVCAPTGTPLVGGQCVACVTSTDCTDSTAPICQGNACVACSSPSQCAGKSSATPACLVATGACVACINDTTCPVGGFSHCDTKTNTCVGCATSVDCMGTTPICTAGVCGKCTIGKQCADRDPTRPMCTPDGCVQCSTNTDCSGAKDRPYCDSATKSCVACLTSQNCPEATPICEAGVCARCTEAAGACSTRSAATPACSGSGKCVQCTDTSGTCTGATPACNGLAGLCVQCMNNTTCGSSTPVCDTTTKTCVGCLESASCPAATPVCDTKQTKCVECLDDNGCNKDPKKPLCTNGTCTACTASDRCKTRSPTAPACALSGAQAGSCVQCTDKTTCVGTATPACNTNTNTCVECVENSDCKGIANPICGADNKCRACATGSECTAKNPLLSACAQNGACVQCVNDATCKGTTPWCDVSTFTCVQCLTRENCSGTTPICEAETKACHRCAADSECTGIGPGVCMSHQDGRCASNGESIVVSSGGAFPSVGELVGKTLVVMQGATGKSVDWDLVGKPQVSIIGQGNGATIYGGTPCVRMSNGDLYIRNLTISGCQAGIQTKGGLLRLERVSAVDNEIAGILIEGGGFEIRDTTISGGNAMSGYGIWLREIPNSATLTKLLNSCTISATPSYGVFCETWADIPSTRDRLSVEVKDGRGGVSPNCNFFSCGPPGDTCGVQAP